MTTETDEMTVLVVGIVTHLWRHPKFVAGCEVCQCIKTGRWPRSDGESRK